MKINSKNMTGALDGSVTIDNRILLGFIEQNVYERDEDTGEILKDENGNAIVKRDSNGNPVTTNGYQSIYSDVRNFGTNAAGALVGATGTVINTIKTTYDTIVDEKSSITQIGRNWKKGQNSLTTALVRGSDDTVKEIMNKINKGEATPEELQYIASRTSKDEKGNLIFTSDGKSIIVKDVDGRVGEQLGFNDKTIHQGYVDAGKTATDSRAFMTVDSEERMHNTVESETVAKNMANREVGYYNAIAFLTGGKGLAISNKLNNGGINSQMQSNWNNKYNTSTNALLAQNTQMANRVKDEDKLYSTTVVVDHGDKAKKHTLTSKLEEQEKLREKVINASLKGENIELTSEEISLLFASVDDLAKQTREKNERQDVEDLFNNIRDYLVSNKKDESDNTLLGLFNLIAKSKNNKITEDDLNNIESGTVFSASADGNPTIYEHYGNKVGETLNHDDYIFRDEASIDFDTKIGKALGINGLYGDNAEEMMGELIQFEIGGSFKNGGENYPYVDYLGIMTTGIGININTQSMLSQLNFIDKDNNIVDNTALYKELSNIKY